MIKFVPILTLAATMTLPLLAHAQNTSSQDTSNQAGSKENPQSSAAATPGNDKHSAGTVGAMKGAEGGSFTASPSDQKTDSLMAK